MKKLMLILACMLGFRIYGMECIRKEQAFFVIDYKNEADEDLRMELIEHFYKNNSKHVFFSSSLLPGLKKSYEEAFHYFESLGIKKPLEQIAIQPVYHAGFGLWNEHDQDKPNQEILENFKEGKKYYRAIYFEDFSEYGAETAVKELKNKIRGRDSSAEFRKNFEIILALAQNWKFFDTFHGLCYGTNQLVSCEDSPFFLKKFLKIDSFEQLSKCQKNDWCFALCDIFKNDFNIHWAFYINGHGDEGDRIAGLKQKKFVKLVQFFNNFLRTDVIVVNSCYVHADRIFQALKSESQGISLRFPVISTVAKLIEAKRVPSEIKLYFPPGRFNVGKKPLVKSKDFQINIAQLISSLHEDVFNDEFLGHDQASQLLATLRRYAFKQDHSMLLPESIEQVVI